MNKKKICYNAGQPLWFWGADQNDTTHLRLMLKLDHEIDREDLLLAWKETMEIYPLLNWIPDKVKGELVFYEPEDEPRVIHYNGPIAPYTEISGNRAIAISYDKNSIILTFYHSVADAAGIIGVLKTLIYKYCSIHFKREYEKNEIMLIKNRDVQEYYSSPFQLQLGEYTPQPLAFYPIGDTIFTDSEMAPAVPGEIVTSSVTILAEEFIAYCKKYGATPSVMLCILLGKAIYNSHPDEKRRVALDVTVNYRKALGLSECLGVFSTAATVCASYDEIMNQPLKDLSKRLRADLAKQRTEDYAKTMMDMARTYLMLKDALSGVISYEGKIDFGSCNEHVMDVSLANNVTNTIHMIEFKNSFILHFQFGKATTWYQKAFIKELKDAGIHIKAMTEAVSIPNEVSEI